MILETELDGELNFLRLLVRRPLRKRTEKSLKKPGSSGGFSALSLRLALAFAIYRCGLTEEQKLAVKCILDLKLNILSK